MVLALGQIPLNVLGSNRMVGAALEGELFKNTELRHQLEQVREHDLGFGNHDVAQSGFGGVVLDLRKGKHDSAFPIDFVPLRITGTLVQFESPDVDGELPIILVTDGVEFWFSRSEESLAASS